MLSRTERGLVVVFVGTLALAVNPCDIRFTMQERHWRRAVNLHLEVTMDVGIERADQLVVHAGRVLFAMLLLERLVVSGERLRQNGFFAGQHIAAKKHDSIASGTSLMELVVSDKPNEITLQRAQHLLLHVDHRNGIGHGLKVVHFLGNVLLHFTDKIQGKRKW
jgi:hypothetical protein